MHRLKQPQSHRHFVNVRSVSPVSTADLPVSSTTLHTATSTSPSRTLLTRNPQAMTIIPSASNASVYASHATAVRASSSSVLALQPSWTRPSRRINRGLCVREPVSIVHRLMACMVDTLLPIALTAFVFSTHALLPLLHVSNGHRCITTYG